MPNDAFNENEDHFQIYQRNGNWLAAEIDRRFEVANCSFVCPNGALSISGLNTVCSSTATYSISGLSPNTTVTWYAEPTGIVNLTPNGNSVIVSRITDGIISLRANLLANGCGKTISKAVNIAFNGFIGTGNISSLIYGTFGGNWTYSPGVDEMFFANPTAPATTYEWEISGADILDGQGTDRLSVRIWQISGTEPYYGFVRLTLGNECGQGNPVTANFTIQPGGPVMLSVNPNPASEELNVEIIEQESQAETLSSSPKSPPPAGGLGGFHFRLYNAYGVLLDSFTKTEKRFSINIFALEAGLYYLQLLYKNNRIAKKVVVGR